MTPFLPAALLLAAALPAAIAAFAPDAPAEPTSVGFSAARESLSNDSPDWRESTLRATHKFGARHLLDIGLTETRRFGLRDEQIGAGYAVPLGPRLTATLDAQFSPTHRALARTAFGALVQAEFAPGWLAHAGARTSEYDAVRVNGGIFLLEHYFSSFSWMVGWRPTRAFGTTAHGAELRGSYYYGDKNSVGVILAGGEEAAAIGSTVVLADLRSAALTGRRWVARRWAVNYGHGSTRQGDFYTRNGITLGVQYAF